MCVYNRSVCMIIMQICIQIKYPLNCVIGFCLWCSRELLTSAFNLLGADVIKHNILKQSSARVQKKCNVTYAKQQINVQQS